MDDFTPVPKYNTGDYVRFSENSYQIISIYGYISPSKYIEMWIYRLDSNVRFFREDHLFRYSLENIKEIIENFEIQLDSIVKRNLADDINYRIGEIVKRRPYLTDEERNNIKLEMENQRAKRINDYNDELNHYKNIFDVLSKQ
jgi:hypothetical protein